MDFDISWLEPTEMQLEAWKHACNAMGIPKKDREWAEKGNRHHMLVMHNAIGRSLAVDAEIYNGPAHKMTPYGLAEMMLTAHGSLWFTQAKGWAGGIPPYCADEKTTRVFQIAGQAIANSDNIFSFRLQRKHMIESSRGIDLTAGYLQFLGYPA